MRDLVETVIAQVMKEPYGSPSAVRGGASAGKQRGAVRGYASVNSFDNSEIKDKKLWDVCCKFEAIFMQQMMSAMRKSVPESDFLPHGFAEGVHDSMLDQAIADFGSKQGRLGIARQMYRQLESIKSGREEAIQGMDKATDNVNMAIYNDMKGNGYGSD